MHNLINELEEKFSLIEAPEYSKLVHFQDFKNTPIDRWFYYQEGFSSTLLSTLIDDNFIPSNLKRVLDPFCGSGSTLVSAQNLGFETVGLDVNPVAAIVSKVKTQNYTSEDLTQLKEFKLSRYSRPLKGVFEKYELSIINKLFSLENLSKIERAKKQINLIKNSKVRELIFVALLSVLETSSNYKKGGNGLKKRKTQNNADFDDLFEKKIKQIFEDLSNIDVRKKSVVINSDSLEVDTLIKDNSIDLCFYSPPYANCFDYFEIYKIELWVGEFVKSYEELRLKRKQALVSNLSANLKKEILNNVSSRLLDENLKEIESKKLHDKRIPKMLNLYFQDMKFFMTQAYQKLSDKGYMVIVVGNSSYGGQPLLTDLILTEISTNIGFKVCKILAARRNETSSQQYKSIGKKARYVRESIIILRK